MSCRKAFLTLSSHKFNDHVAERFINRYVHRVVLYVTQLVLFHRKLQFHPCRYEDFVLCHTGLVYIAGGFNGQECLSSAEYYDPIVNQWTVIAHMRSKRSGVGIATYCGHVYAVGGFDGTHRLFSAERYDPDINKWQPVASMCSSRSNFAIEVRRLTRSESGSVASIQ